MEHLPIKAFSRAELEHLREKAKNANMAIAMHQEFVEFLRVQHDAPEQDGWLLGANGFERARNETASALVASGAEAVNGAVDEFEVSVAR